MAKQTILFPRSSGSSFGGNSPVIVETIAYQEDGVFVTFKKNGKPVTRFYPFTSVDYVETREV